MGRGDADVTAVRNMLHAGKMEPYLRHIRFPRFRNLADDLRIDFTFPVTALIGANGTNKTAILRALQGCPDYSHIGLYWFSTAVDPIEDGKGNNRIRFIHGWNPPSVGATVEALKQRETSSDDPDYFEPAKPRVSDEMAPMPEGVGELNTGRGRSQRLERSADRWNPIPTNVEYIDFRSELSAYDKYFFHNPYRRRSKDTAALPAEERSRKGLIRDRAVHLRRALDGMRTSNRMGGREHIHTPLFSLPPEEVKAVSRILGRAYASIDLIEHSLYEVQGWTVVLRSDHHRYTEAFAGSGEFAVVRLVHRIMTTEDASLVLLDEPEVSLHPGAQHELIRFILDQAKRRHLQVVFSTHSPELIRPLPPDAIKVLQLRPDGRVELRSQESLPDEAFVVVGHEVERRTIFVEDDLAVEIVRHALRTHRPALLKSIDVKAHPGGASDIKRSITTWALSHESKVLVLFDGDQRRDVANDPFSDLAGEALANRVREVTGEARLSLARSSGASAEEARRTFLRWWDTNARFLPGHEPERLLLAMLGEPVGDEIDTKARWMERTGTEVPYDPSVDTLRGEDILQTQKRALLEVDESHPDLRLIADTVKDWLRDGD